MDDIETQRHNGTGAHDDLPQASAGRITRLPRNTYARAFPFVLCTRSSSSLDSPSSPSSCSSSSLCAARAGDELPSVKSRLPWLPSSEPNTSHGLRGARGRACAGSERRADIFSFGAAAAGGAAGGCSADARGARVLGPASRSRVRSPGKRTATASVERLGRRAWMRTLDGPSCSSSSSSGSGLGARRSPVAAPNTSGFVLRLLYGRNFGGFGGAGTYLIVLNLDSSPGLRPVSRRRLGIGANGRRSIELFAVESSLEDASRAACVLVRLAACEGEDSGSL